MPSTRARPRSRSRASSRSRSRPIAFSNLHEAHNDELIQPFTHKSPKKYRADHPSDSDHTRSTSYHTQNDDRSVSSNQTFSFQTPKIQKPIPDFLLTASQPSYQAHLQQLQDSYTQNLMRRRASFLGQPDPFSNPTPAPGTTSTSPVLNISSNPIPDNPIPSNPVLHSHFNPTELPPLPIIDRTAPSSSQNTFNSPKSLPPIPTLTPAQTQQKQSSEPLDPSTLDLSNDEQWKQFQEYMLDQDPVSRYIHDHVGALPRHVPIKQWGAMAQAIFNVDTQQFDQLSNQQLDLLNQDEHCRAFSIDKGIDATLLTQASLDPHALDKRYAKAHALNQSGLSDDFSHSGRSALSLDDQLDLGRLDQFRAQLELAEATPEQLANTAQEMGPTVARSIMRP